jgi:hypothetical protein
MRRTQASKAGQDAANPGNCAMRDALTHIVNVTFPVLFTVTIIVTLSWNVRTMVFVYQCY